jgi:hypothetical protein
VLFTDLLEKGILFHSSVTDDGIEFLFPLLLQAWVENHQAFTMYGYHLNGLFDAGLIVDQDVVNG